MLRQNMRGMATSLEGFLEATPEDSAGDWEADGVGVVGWIMHASI
ncbi:hypothetical protein [Belnapia moabensis]|nr:hypothetical protein [Belnapia moabensis]